MKTIIAIALATLALFASAQEVEQFVKRDGDISLLRMKDGYMPFDMYAARGQYTCEMKGRAQFIDKTRAAFTDEDGGKCVAVFNFKGRNLMVTTKDCEAYCGLGASGSMDGTYAFKK